MNANGSKTADARYQHIQRRRQSLTLRHVEFIWQFPVNISRRPQQALVESEHTACPNGDRPWHLCVSESDY